jgi:hypothetical protein
MSDDFEYIRKKYKVPAKLGARIRYTGGVKPKVGKIIGTINGHLIVKLNGQRMTYPYHPTWKIEYLDNEAEVASP